MPAVESLQAERQIDQIREPRWRGGGGANERRGGGGCQRGRQRDNSRRGRRDNSGRFCGCLPRLSAGGVQCLGESMDCDGQIDKTLPGNEEKTEKIGPCTEARGEAISARPTLGLAASLPT